MWGKTKNPQLMKALYDVDQNNSNQILDVDQNAIAKKTFWSSHFHQYTTWRGGRRNKKKLRKTRRLPPGRLRFSQRKKE